MSLEIKEFEFKCNSCEWSFWSRLLPLRVYAETGMSVDELIDDAMSFYVYAFSDLSTLNRKRKWNPWDFAPVSWNLITGFGDLTSLLSEVGETVDESVRNQRAYQLSLGEALGDLVPDDLPSLSEKDVPAKTPSMGSFKEWETVFYSHYTLESVATLVGAISSAFQNLKVDDAKVIVSEKTLNEFRAITSRFGVSDVSAILTVMRQIRIFMPLSSGYTNSFREDLFVRRLNCQALRARWVQELEITEAHCARLDAMGSVIAERLASLHQGVSGGQSLSEFLAGENSPRELEETDFSSATNLTEAERLQADTFLF